MRGIAAIAAALALSSCGAANSEPRTVPDGAGMAITQATLDLSHYCLAMLDDKWTARIYDQALDAVAVLTTQLYRSPNAVMDVGDSTVREEVVAAADILDGCDGRLMGRLDRALARAGD